MPDAHVLRMIRMFQKSEITEHVVYQKLAAALTSSVNKDILLKIAAEEKTHHDIWKKYTNRDAVPDRFRIWFYFLTARVLGLTFGVKLMERQEQAAQAVYRSLGTEIPEAEAMARDEEKHESQLLSLIDEERLKYVGSIVLGLNDALVELTGALAGLTLALRHTRLVAMAGLITGIAASLSMAASEYISTKSENTGKNPVKASVYTGITYILTVFFLISPYLLFSRLFLCLALTVLNAVIVIFLFTFYVAVAQDIPFRRRFAEMTSLSLGVAALSFVLGFVVRKFMGIDI